MYGKTDGNIEQVLTGKESQLGEGLQRIFAKHDIKHDSHTVEMSSGLPVIPCVSGAVNHKQKHTHV